MARIYVAGKMRGIPLYNFPAFDARKHELEALGHRVISPADLDRAYGFDPYKGDTAETDGANFDMKSAIRRDVDALLNCDWLVLLDGWETSVGATGEIAIAKWVGMQIFYPGDKVPPSSSYSEQAENELNAVK